MKIKYLFGLVLATMLYSSCSEDMMDRINKDETSKTSDRVGAKFQLTDAEVATAYSVVNGEQRVERHLQQPDESEADD